MGNPFARNYNEILIFCKFRWVDAKPFTHYYNEILIFFGMGRRGYQISSKFIIATVLTKSKVDGTFPI